MALIIARRLMSVAPALLRHTHFWSSFRSIIVVVGVLKSLLMHIMKQSAMKVIGEQQYYVGDESRRNNDGLDSFCFVGAS